MVKGYCEYRCFHKSFALLKSAGSVENFLSIGLSSTDNSFDDVVPVILDNQEGWHGFDLVGLGDFLGFVNIDLDEGDASFVAQFVENWGDGLAGTAPGGIAVDHGDTSSGDEELLDLVGAGGFEFRHGYCIFYISVKNPWIYNIARIFLANSGHVITDLTSS